MTTNLSSLYQEIPPRCTAYDYDNPGPPFSSESITAIDSIKAFLSPSELGQARRIETVYYAPIIKNGVGTFIPGLRSYSTSICLYVGRFDDKNYSVMLENFLKAVHVGIPEANLDAVDSPWFRVITPDGRRNYPLEFNESLQAWKDRIIEVSKNFRTTVGWFDQGKFCLADGRRYSFGDLTIDRAAGGKPMPRDW